MAYVGFNEKKIVDLLLHIIWYFLMKTESD
jgi:hypothetical protein